ncbi:hypothetical protein ATANTOWER_026683 [Ataeniobius toweri]|uniref:Uncharacterized protein n=1 Tax=Ataeniobius toweri TaxID=208326 RepID=A0ABU7CCL9_9TELE|nr:hypothetical protein [Ataeniobius toweri]
MLRCDVTLNKPSFQVDPSNRTLTSAAEAPAASGRPEKPGRCCGDEELCVSQVEAENVTFLYLFSVFTPNVWAAQVLYIYCHRLSQCATQVISEVQLYTFIPDREMYFKHLLLLLMTAA